MVLSVFLFSSRGSWVPTFSKLNENSSRLPLLSCKSDRSVVLPFNTLIRTDLSRSLWRVRRQLRCTQLRNDPEPSKVCYYIPWPVLYPVFNRWIDQHWYGLICRGVFASSWTTTLPQQRVILYSLNWPLSCWMDRPTLLRIDLPRTVCEFVGNFIASTS